MDMDRLISMNSMSVGGRLMLVDMASPEHIEQASQTRLEAKMQTGLSSSSRNRWANFRSNLSELFSLR